VVTRDVADHALVVGVPAEVAGWVCECGARLALSDGGGECGGCARTYVPDGEGGLRRA
jgi:UDP-2-acetamido-3-amino-2,3-dideoxy-glucuronate N-acetyltransferase